MRQPWVSKSKMMVILLGCFLVSLAQPLKIGATEDECTTLIRWDETLFDIPDAGEWVERLVDKVVTPPPYVVSDAAQALHSQLFVSDMHCDTLLRNRNLLKKADYGHVDIPRLIEGHVALQTFAASTADPVIYNDPYSLDMEYFMAVLGGWPISSWFSLKYRALYLAGKLADISRQSGGKLVIIKSAHDLRALAQRKKTNPNITGGLLAIEGLHALEGNISTVDVFYKAGYRMMSPTWRFDNAVGGSSEGKKKGGLTAFGKNVIRATQRRHIIIDLAHASSQTIDDVLAITTGPVVVSHTGVRGLVDNDRNISDESVKKIAARGGVIGVGYWDVAVGAPDVKSIAQTMRYLRDMVGAEHIGLGSDFDGAITAPFDASGVALITEELMRQGFTDSEIQQIMGGNIVRVFTEVLE